VVCLGGRLCIIVDFIAAEFITAEARLIGPCVWGLATDLSRRRGRTLSCRHDVQ
jgi:hypothetical protein